MDSNSESMTLMEKAADNPSPEMPGGPWAAMITPFTGKLEVDGESLGHLLRFGARSGINGVFLGGTAGEGPFLSRAQFEDMLRQAVLNNEGGMTLAAQVTANSAAQVAENIEVVRSLGIDVPITSEPYFPKPLSPRGEAVAEYFDAVLEVANGPIGLYFRQDIHEPDDLLRFLSHPSVVLVKDSTQSSVIRKAVMDVRASGKDFRVYTGDEFECLDALRAGYDGIIAGGGAIIAPMMKRLCDAQDAGREEEAEAIVADMRSFLLTTYGGSGYPSWLTGLKYALKRMGLISTTRGMIEFPLDSGQMKAIDELLEKSGLL